VAGVALVVLFTLLVASPAWGEVVTSKEKPEPDTLVAWPYISWRPSAIYVGSIAYLDAGITIVTTGLAPSSYSIQVVIYDPSPAQNGSPQIVAYSLSGCDVVPKFTYDYNRRAWIFYSGVCTTRLPAGIYSFGITASWQPKAPSVYTAEVTACVHEIIGGCESASAYLTVYT